MKIKFLVAIGVVLCIGIAAMLLVRDPVKIEPFALPDGTIYAIDAVPFEMPADANVDEKLAAFWKQAEQAYREERYTHSAAAMKEVVALDFRSVDAAYYHGSALLLGGDADTASAELERALFFAEESGYPTDGIEWMYAQALVAMQDGETARGVLEGIISSKTAYADRAKSLLSHLQ